MIKWLKRKHSHAEQAHQNVETTVIVEQPEETSEQLPQKKNLVARFAQGLIKTRHQLGDRIASLLLGKKTIDAELLDDLETLLLGADLGVETSQAILQQLKEDLTRKELADGVMVMNALHARLQACLTPCAKPLIIPPATTRNHPFVILMVGVNGAGKTTTIGKLAQQLQREGHKVMLAAGDTFRAAAVEQLQNWGERNNVAVIAQHQGADSASVVFDALQAAKTRHVDVLIADTAGRLHTQHHLMEELKKVKRVLQKIDPTAPHEIMLVLDASIGQNALNQACQFHDALGLTGITMTKLDGTARGGILFAIAHQLNLPFRYLGMGEGIDDLRLFDAEQFVNAIFYDDRI